MVRSFSIQAVHYEKSCRSLNVEHAIVGELLLFGASATLIILLATTRAALLAAALLSTALLATTRAPLLAAAFFSTAATARLASTLLATTTALSFFILKHFLVLPCSKVVVNGGCICLSLDCLSKRTKLTCSHVNRTAFTFQLNIGKSNATSR
jgi:hypothetical protein